MALKQNDIWSFLVVRNSVGITSFDLYIL